MLFSDKLYQMRQVIAVNEKELLPAEQETVRNCFLFDEADAAAVAAALADESCRLLCFRKGETVPQVEAGLLLTGELRAESLSGSRRLYMRSLVPGNLFGVTALYGGDGQVSLLTAQRDSRVLFFTQALLTGLMRQDFRVAENYIRFLSGRLRYLNRKIAFLAAGSVDEMLALRLLDGETDILPVRSYASLAQEMGVGRASLYRALEKLTEAGYIARDSSGIHILDRKRLEDIVQ